MLGSGCNGGFLLPQGKKEAMQDALICLSCYCVVTDGGLRGE
jgi:hypothetical protein